MVIKKCEVPGTVTCAVTEGQAFLPLWLASCASLPAFSVSHLGSHRQETNQCPLHNNEITTIAFFHGNIPILYVSLVPLFFYANITCLAKGMRINCTGPSILVSWGKRIKLSPILVDKQKYLYYFFYLGHGNLNFYLSFSYNILNEESRMTSSWQG